MSRGHLYRVSVTRPAGELWSTGWDNPQEVLMAPDNKGGVFVLSRGHLYHVTEKQKDGGARWSDGWNDPFDMKTDMNGGVLIVNGQTLYHVTSQNKMGERLSDGWLYADYQRQSSIDVDGKGGLYMGRGSELWHVPVPGTPRKISKTNGNLMYGVTWDGGDSVYFMDIRHGSDTLVHAGKYEKYNDLSDGWKTKLTATNTLGGIIFLQRDGTLMSASTEFPKGEVLSKGYTPPSGMDVTHRGGMVSDGDGGVFLLSKDALFHCHGNKKDYWSNQWASNSAVFVVGK